MTQPGTEVPFSIAILAGGQSKRMGQHKALLSIDQEPVLQRIIRAVQPLCADLFLVTNSPQLYQQFELPMVADIIPGKAALGGIYTALVKAQQAWVMVLACDMPFIDRAVIRYLASLIDDQAAIVCPLDDGGRPEPLHCFYHKQCLATIEQRLRADQLKVSQILAMFRVRYVDYLQTASRASSANFLLNMNTLSDFEQVQKLSAEAKQDSDQKPPTRCHDAGT